MPSEPWDALDQIKYQSEHEAVAGLLAATPLSASERDIAVRDAGLLSSEARRATGARGGIETFLQEFSLSTAEGLALMGLAEALLRTPDAQTRDRLIAEKVLAGNWSAHLGQSESLLINATAWGLMLTGRIIEGPDMEDGWRAIRRLIARVGEPVVRLAIGQAVRIIGEQFVSGRTIEEAIARAKDQKLLCSFDMLGEGARNEEDARRYEEAYRAAIEAMGKAPGPPEAKHGISVKLSALSPRYEAVQETRVWQELYPRLLDLAERAAEADINLTIDAEEADRLVLSLKLLDRLTREPGLGRWAGLGLAVQSYQKRAVRVIAALAGLAQQSRRRLMVRLVKGAYWDSEIKKAQVLGRPGYPVFTTKHATDLSYLVCAKTLLAASPHLYPQFATHNAHTLAAVRLMAQKAGLPVEYQRLQGMGEPLYQAADAHFGPLKPRVYAPVGAHQDLLPYLARRLLENGANTSFVHRLLDKDTPSQQLASDPITQAENHPGPHPDIPLPRHLYGDRLNSEGVDLTIGLERERLARAEPFHCTIADAAPADIDRAFHTARLAQPGWDARGGEGRAELLFAMADGLEKDRDALMALIVREAGKCWPDAISEVREAADFCRYYGLLAQRHFSQPLRLKGPAGESNLLELHGRGVFSCISPWNFPLAIFTGQIAAALAAGNTVVAKPAEQTPKIAAAAVALFRQAGLPEEVLQLVTGPGETVGAALVEHIHLAGLAFTGGTETARAINQKLAARPGALLPFIAETGGLNAMFVDTTALREQVIDDVLLSAFGSAGQRCSALRILFLPEETADSLIAGIGGAMDALSVDDPLRFTTDIGPIIDGEALRALERHRTWLRQAGLILKELKPAGSDPLLFGPVMAEISPAQMPEREVFGPILHVIRYRSDQLDRLATALAGKGYGLTLGVHSRLTSFATRIRSLVPAGNVYVNRSIIGAVVGVQPFGGEGLSGTGPKAGGPYSLARYSVERAVSVNTAAQGGDPVLLNLTLERE